MTIISTEHPSKNREICGHFLFPSLLNPRDYLHEQALAFSRARGTKLLTATWILMELGNAVSASPLRRRFVELVLNIARSPTLKVVLADENDFLHSFELYKQRPDKDWSLTDCISFLVMQEYGRYRSLTADHHFTQAGFRASSQN